MKQIDLDSVQPDPIVAARVAAGSPTVTVRGKVRSVDDTSVSICLDAGGSKYAEYPREAVLAAFADDDSSEISIVVLKGATVRLVTQAQVAEPPTVRRAPKQEDGCGCEGGPRAVAARRIGGGPAGGFLGGGGRFAPPGLISCGGGFCTCDSYDECIIMLGGGMCSGPAICFDTADGGVFCVCVE